MKNFNKRFSISCGVISFTPNQKNSILYLINMQRLKNGDRNIIQRSMQEADYETLTDKKLRVNQRKAARG